MRLQVEAFPDDWVEEIDKTIRVQITASSRAEAVRRMVRFAMTALELRRQGGQVYVELNGERSELSI